MGVKRFEVLVRDQGIGQELRREWTKPELLKSIAWLKRMNARGSDVLVRPAGPHGLVLMDALDSEKLAAMCHMGLEPAVVVESNPGEYQAWLALSARPVADQVRQLAAEALTRGVGGISSESAATRFGRLAGFTFGEKAREPMVNRRFVLAHEGRAPVATNGEILIAKIENALHAQRDRTQTKVQQAGKYRGRSR